MNKTIETAPKKVIDFIGKRKIFFGISIAIMALGIICNLIFGTQLDIQFTGGAIVKYSYTGAIDEEQLKDVLQKATDQEISFSISKNMIAGEENTGDKYIVSLQFTGTNSIDFNQQKAITEALETTFPDNGFEYSESSSVESTMGGKFFLKCLVAVAIACVLMVLYVTFRFRKINGFAAGIMALVALFHDVLVIYFLYVILRIPIDGNFIAVVLMILGYSLNNTIVAYDRIRENRKILGGRTDLATLTNTSLTQVLKRSILTTVTTVMAVGCVYAVGIIFNLDSIVKFALPTIVGLISGCYSSLAIAPSLWVVWENHKKSKGKKTA